MKRIFLAFLVGLAVLSSCSRKAGFEISVAGTPSDIPTVYLNGSSTTLLEADSVGSDSWKMVGQSADTVLADLFVGGRRLFTFPIYDGARYTFEIKGDTLTGASGSPVIDSLYRLLPVLGRLSPDKRCSALERLVKSQPTDLATTCALISTFPLGDNQALADSMLRLLAPEARPMSLIAPFTALFNRNGRLESRRVGAFRLIGDTTTASPVRQFLPSRSSYSLLIFTGPSFETRDLVVDSTSAKRLNWPDSLYATFSKAKSKRIVHITVGGDSLAWRTSITALDKTKLPRDISHYWRPGGLGDLDIRPLEIPSLPYTILVDSLGNQLHRSR